MIITEPGIYDLPLSEYHADPVLGGSMSSSMAREILKAPAKLLYKRTHPEPPNPAFQFGTAAHTVILGDGPETVIIDAADWRSKTAREERDAALAAGRTPLLKAEADKLSAMKQAVQAHSQAAAILAEGKPEQSFFTKDPHTLAWMRARPDWLTTSSNLGDVVILDYKTTVNADPTDFAKSVANYGYHQQAAWYLDVIGQVMALPEDATARFIFLAQEKEPPFLTSLVELDGTALEIGREWNRAAIDMWTECLQAGEWPGYPQYLQTISLPAWAARPWED